MTDTFINTNATAPNKIDLEGLNKICEDWHKAFIGQFEGIPVHIDDTLVGNQYYIAVSHELFEELKIKNDYHK